MHRASRSHRFLRLQSRNHPIHQLYHAANPNSRCLRPANQACRQLYLICDAKHCRQIVRSLWQTRTQTHILYILYILYCTYESHTHVGGGAAFRNRQEKTRPDGMVAMFSLEDTPRSVPCFDPIEQGNCINWEVMILAVGTHRKRTI